MRLYTARCVWESLYCFFPIRNSLYTRNVLYVIHFGLFTFLLASCLIYAQPLPAHRFKTLSLFESILFVHGWVAVMRYLRGSVRLSFLLRRHHAASAATNCQPRVTSSRVFTRRTVSRQSPIPGRVSTFHELLHPGRSEQTLAVVRWNVTVSLWLRLGQIMTDFNNFCTAVRNLKWGWEKLCICHLTVLTASY